MDRDCTQHNLDVTESTSSSNGNFEIYDIGEAVAFDENDQVVSLEADEETIAFSEDDLLDLADHTEDTAPQMMGLMSAPKALHAQTKPTKESIRNSVLYLVNQQRQRYGRRPLRFDSKLTRAAQSHSEDMARYRRISHVGSDGSSVGMRVKRTGYRYRNVAENVAQGQDTSREVMISWMRSPDHRRNLLNSSYTEIGIGVAYGPRGPYWTQVFARER
jgi:uncharacterized protein YkwD